MHENPFFYLPVAHMWPLWFPITPCPLLVGHDSRKMSFLALRDTDPPPNILKLKGRKKEKNNERKIAKYINNQTLITDIFRESS